MHPLLLGLVLFIVSVTIIELALYARRLINSPDRKKIKRRLHEMSAKERESVLNSILRDKSFSDMPLLNRILNRINLAHRLKRLKEQANAEQSVGFFLLLSLMLAVLSVMAVSLALPGTPLLLLAAGAGAFAPWAYLLVKKKKRMERFRHQLPEAMELIARSLKAGHAFSSGLKLASEQMDDPVGVEFAATIHEINFGVSVSDALHHLAKRVDCPDLQIFVVSVVLQRETGGNLAEIMDNNARIIRERFKFQNHVKTLSAEGKLSAVVLFVLPILVFLGINVLNPGYTDVLLSTPLGRNLLWGAGGMMVAGMIIIKRMVVIEA